jgi:hypothetical protein
VRARPAAVALNTGSVAVAFTRSTAAYVTTVSYLGNTVSTFTAPTFIADVVTNSPPAITKRNNSAAPAPYRVIGVSRSLGWFWHEMANASSGVYIGGIPKSGTGASAVATGSFSADIVKNGTEQLASAEK